ncbi:peroxiredoxin-like family protein [Actinomadura xylanilytica]|uniref:peroxiredoxin-like family protein n=1 Tax=Actinomadura xylanilytica TaxID=887459 RepID=UPI00255AE894|nr:peroxiredoxin-like family protein [Actinomadura xylanilytica]MDL4770650.1 peroxiredoxin-like family protein [Actinomadura xylanilytica]
MNASDRLGPGSVVPARELESVTGAPALVPDGEHLVHLQFRRFAGCPICNLHLRSVVRRHDEIEAAGVREVVVFHSSAGELREHVADLPFAVVADPRKRLYAEFGVEAVPRALLHPRAWWPLLRAVTEGTWRIARKLDRAPAGLPENGRFGLPADFLIAPDGGVAAAKYGEHANDQWPVDEILARAAESYGSARPVRTSTRA